MYFVVPKTAITILNLKIGVARLRKRYSLWESEID